MALVVPMSMLIFLGTSLFVIFTRLSPSCNFLQLSLLHLKAQTFSTWGYISYSSYTKCQLFSSINLMP